ncbi:MAG: CAP domain-containing protein [Oscillospiraceae bacterium]|nr:CAP domain-containing protein [Oscillospiraceae bacterium]
MNKSRISALSLILTLTLTLIPVPATALAAYQTALPTSHTLLVDGKSTPSDAYNIGDSNYFMLRDLALLLNGTPKQFGVDFKDGVIVLTTGAPYIPNGTELRGTGTETKKTTVTAQKILLDGVESTFDAYFIDDSNYFKLRDLGITFDFSVEWTGSMEIDTSRGYGVRVGDTLGRVETVLGAPRRTLTESPDAQWMFYGEYSRFAMVRAENGRVTTLYVNYDLTIEPDKLWTDSNDGGSVYAVSAGSYAGADVATEEQIIFELTNAFRAFNGLAPLTWNDQLAKAARAHSEDMAVKGYFDHDSPDGRGLRERLDAVGYRWYTAGENIIAGYSNGVSAVDGWINSEEHRENMLKRGFEEIGVGWVIGGDYGKYGTQDFGTSW